ncbi:trypsin-like peptidase domain-containing protein [Buchnera aphidicola (Mollitrichosiphum nigrofasciatum)]|uniref:trypsin-like peptidase domain-containing protein n=1 Tax=Buchnera aphidicola TaxID=9 RepID=UPI0031B88CD6
MKKYNLFFLLFFILFFLKIFYINKNFLFFLNKQLLQNKNLNFHEILEKVLPSMVSVICEENVINDSILNSKINFFFKKKYPFCNNFSPYFFSHICKKTKNFTHHVKKYKFFRNTSLGSGVIVNSRKGYIITNNHVIKNANKIYVKLYDGRIYTADLIIKDVNIDIAIIKINNVRDLISINIVNKNNTHVGDKVIAIGNSYGLENTVTSGIISSLNRTKLGIEYFENFIQIDAAINQGNSGGALLNINGELIGINTAVFSNNGGNVGIGFSIPIEVVDIMLNRISNLQVFNNYIFNFSSVNINYNISKINNIYSQRGLLINNISFFSVFYFSDIQLGDMIISVNNNRVTDFLSFRMNIMLQNIDKIAHLKVIRRNIVYKIDLVLYKFLLKFNKYYNIDIIFNKRNIIDYIKNNKFFLKINDIKKNSWIYYCNFRESDIILSVNNYNVFSKNLIKYLMYSNLESTVFYIYKNNSFVFFIIH